MEEELELSLDEGYAIFKEEHDSSTLEPIHDKGFTLLKEMHDTKHMYPSHEENYYWKQNPLLFHDDIHIHGCINETSLIHFKSSCFLFSLFGTGTSLSEPLT